MQREELIELSDLNLQEANRELSRRAGGVVHDEGGVLLYAGAHSLPVLCNGAMRTADVSPEEFLRRADAFFATQRRGYTAYLRAHADEAIRVACLEAGFVEFGNAPAMVLERRLPDAAPPDGVTLERVATAEQAGQFASVMSAAYASLRMPADVAPAVIVPAVLTAPHIVSFLARLEDGTPAAGAMCILSHGVAGVYWVGTRPEARGRGLAELCTRAAGNAGFDLGARIASLQASQMGEPVYRRMGYEEVTRYRTIVHFAPPASLHDSP